MIQQSLFPFNIEMTTEKLTAHGGLALMAEFNHGIGLRERTDRYLPAWGFGPSVIAYNLFIGFKRLSYPESWVRHTIATFRWSMVQVAGRIVRHAGKAVLRLMIDLKRLALLKEIRKSLLN